LFADIPKRGRLLFIPLKPMKIRYFLYIIGLVFMQSLHHAEAQQAVQLSGVVMTADSTPQFIPFAYARVRPRSMGTVADEEGFFSIAVLGGDTVEFSHLGFQTQKLYVPDTLNKKKYLVQVFLRRDTAMLAEVTLYPWPTPDRFKSYFMSMRVETTEMDIAQRNLAIQTLRDRAASMGYDAGEIQEVAIKMQEQNMYNGGRFYGADGGAAILGAFTNPFAWAQFFESLKKKD